MREYALVLLVAAAVTYVLTPLVRRIAVATHTIHAPRARDTHTKPTPLLGGLAMYGGMVAGLLVASRLSFLQDPFSAGTRTEAGLLVAGAFVVVVGFVDDRWGLSALSKLAAQVAAAGILVWSGQALPWLPTPSGGVFSLEPDLSLTLTILLVVVTINAINFIDGLDGLAAGITAVAALSFLVYSYTLIKTIGNTSQSLPAVSSALLAGICLGFLPHNFFPARIFMGDIGAMLLGLLLAYGPISSTASLAPALLTNYAHEHALDRFPTLLPLLVPAAIFVIPYADLTFAIIRRTRADKPLMAADRQHLHHRLLNIGHSYRQSVLLMYLWAALFSVTVVSLSLVQSPLVVFAVATLVAVLALLPATMPRLRPWRARTQRKAAAVVAAPHAVAAARAVTAARAGAPMLPGIPPHADFPVNAGLPYPAGPNVGPPYPAGPNAGLQNGNLPHPGLAHPGLPNGSFPDSRSTSADTMPDPALSGGPVSGYLASPYPASASEFPGDQRLPEDGSPDAAPFPGPARVGGYLRAENSFHPTDQYRSSAPFAPQDPFADPVPSGEQGPFGSAAPSAGHDPFADPVPFAEQDHLSGPAQFPGAGPLADGSADGTDPFPPAPHHEARPW